MLHVRDRMIRAYFHISNHLTTAKSIRGRCGAPGASPMQEAAPDHWVHTLEAI